MDSLRTVASAGRANYVEHSKLSTVLAQVIRYRLAKVEERNMINFQRRKTRNLDGK
jgi:hypothetical protein